MNEAFFGPRSRWLLLGVFSALTAVAEPSGSPAVWDRLSWGMVREDVREVYPQAINVNGVFHLEGFEVAKIPFRASLAFTGSAAGLAEINLDCLLPMPDDKDAAGVIAAFRDKYGPPSQESRDAFLQFVWQEAGSLIQLVWSPASDYSPPSLRIFFREVPPSVPAPAEDALANPSP